MAAGPLSAEPATVGGLRSAALKRGCAAGRYSVTTLTALGPLSPLSASKETLAPS
jgi:hypothetical protein